MTSPDPAAAARLAGAAEDLLLEAGQALVAAGRIPEALAHFLAMPRDPASGLAGVIAAARLHAELGNHPAGLGLYEAALQQPGCTRAQERRLRQKRAPHALEAGRPAEALSDYLWLAAHQPELPQGLVGQIEVHLQAFDKRAAAEALRRAKLLHPGDPLVRRIEARYLRQYGEEADLLACMARLQAEALPPEELLGLLRELFGDRKYYFSAALRARLTAQLAPDLGAQALERLLPEARRSGMEERLAAAQKAAARSTAAPDSPQGLRERLRLARARIEAGEREAALALIAGLEESVAGWPYRPPILGELLEWRAAQTGDWEAARASYWARRRMQAGRDRSDELEPLRLLPGAPPPVVVFCQLRNERPVLPAFFRHYRGLGVTRFVMIDNGSQDGSLEWLLAQPDVELYRTPAPFRRAEAGNAWTNPLIARPDYARTLCLRVDADEHLVYPHCETRPLAALWAYMQAEGGEVLAGHMLDLLPETLAAMEGIGEDLSAIPWHYEPPEPRHPTFACPYFTVMGGSRGRLITGRETHLTKCSGLRGGGSIEQQRASHRASPAPVSGVGMVLLHYKFRPDFFSRAARVAGEHHYASASQEFTLYAGLEARRDATLLSAASRPWRGSAALVAEGLLTSPPGWEAWPARAG